MKALVYVLLSLFAAASSHAKGVVEAWSQRYSHGTRSSEVAQQMVVDASGNVIVAGYMLGFISETDILVAKYSNAGNLLWSNRYDGPAHSSDDCYGLAVGTNGNIFVTGSSYNGTNGDILTLAFSSTGVALWTNRYDAGLTDGAAEVAVDGSGNVIITGYSENAGSNYDYLTIKYSSVGMPLWTNRYNGPANGSDSAIALALNGSGSVFVTGVSLGPVADYVTIAYSGDGVPLWTNRFDWDPNDYPSAIATGNNGNVFVTGSSGTVAYSGSGAPLWTNRFGGQAKAVAVATNGTVFITGFNSGYLTIAYSGAGVPLWTNSYQGPGTPHHANAIAVSGGTVYVTGYSYSGVDSFSSDYATVAYSTAGMPLWTNRYNGTGDNEDQANAVAVDGGGNAFVTGYSTGLGTDDDFLTIKYTSEGVPLWTNRLIMPGNLNDQARAVAADANGNIYVTGYSTAFAGTLYAPDFATIAYTSRGVPLWTNRYNGPGNSSDQPNAIAVQGGKVFVTGYSTGVGSGHDFTTIAYSLAGVPLWTNRYSSPGNGADEATGLAVDRNGNVVVTGFAFVITGNSDYITIAYTGDGTALWTNRYTRTSSSDDQASAVAVDTNGNVFVTGYSTGAAGSSTDYLTVGYSAGGVPLWTNRYNFGSVDQATAVAVDHSGNVFVTGNSLSGVTSYDYATIKYLNDGTPQWTVRYDGPANGSDAATALAVDGAGNVFVTGYSTTSGINFDYATVGYSTGGGQLWVKRYGFSSEDQAWAVVTDAAGNVFVTGSSGNGTNKDIATIAYSAAGTALWTNRYEGPASGEDIALTGSALAVVPDGSLYVVGASDGAYSSTANIYDFVTIKYETRPRLLASDVNSMIEVSWASAFIGWQLQMQTGPVSTGLTTNWTPVANSTLTNRFSFPKSNGCAFFRLVGP